jgi:hypothetical protein
MRHETNAPCVPGLELTHHCPSIILTSGVVEDNGHCELNLCLFALNTLSAVCMYLYVVSITMYRLKRHFVGPYIYLGNINNLYAVIGVIYHVL